MWLNGGAGPLDVGVPDELRRGSHEAGRNIEMTRRMLLIGIIPLLAAVGVVGALGLAAHPPSAVQGDVNSSAAAKSVALGGSLVAPGGPSTQPGAQPSPQNGRTTKPLPSPAAPPPVSHPGTAGTCPSGLLVSTPAELTAALANPGPGAIIVMARGVYTGSFTISVSGTAASPDTLCGPSDAIIDGGSSSRALLLQGVSWWHLTGFQIQHGNKGLGLTHASNNVVSRLYIHDTTGALVHINSFSSDNLFDGLTLRNTPREGFYIGSTNGNWCMYSNCQPDASDRNVIQNSDVAGTGSEPINIQEGSSGGKALNNHIDGRALVKAKEWINVKGNGYLIAGNVGVDSVQDGFDVHQNAPGWGNNNTFEGNKATVNGPGYGYYVMPGTTGNRVLANNTATNAGKGLANIPTV
jgi:hypothetical protein